MREQDWRANYYEALRERNEAEAKLARVWSEYEHGRQDERAAWQRALADSKLPNTYVRLVRDLALVCHLRRTAGVRLPRPPQRTAPRRLPAMGGAEVTACLLCGGYGSRHDPIAHDAEPTWITCPTCAGDGSVRDVFDLDTTCPDCNGDGGMEP